MNEDGLKNEDLVSRYRIPGEKTGMSGVFLPLFQYNPLVLGVPNGAGRL